jgi:hypothetical protein
VQLHTFAPKRHGSNINLLQACEGPASGLVPVVDDGSPVQRSRCPDMSPSLLPFLLPTSTKTSMRYSPPRGSQSRGRMSALRGRRRFARAAIEMSRHEPVLEGPPAKRTFDHEIGCPSQAWSKLMSTSTSNGSRSAGGSNTKDGSSRCSFTLPVVDDGSPVQRSRCPDMSPFLRDRPQSGHSTTRFGRGPFAGLEQVDVDVYFEWLEKRRRLEHERWIQHSWRDPYRLRWSTRCGRVDEEP